MADRLNFHPNDLRRGMTVAKIVKPKSNDFVLIPGKEEVALVSIDKRRMMVSKVPCQGSVANDGDEYLIPATRSSLFLSEGDQASLTLNKEGLRIRVKGDGKARQATFKRRSVTAKKVSFPRVPLGSLSSVNAKSFSLLLKAVSCSALVRKTKTEEEMRINQVHFYGNTAFSSTRFHASVAKLEGMSLDLSITSTDIPSIRAFCSRVRGEDVQLAQDNARLYVVDPSVGSTMVVSRVIGKKPTLSFPDPDKFGLEVKVSRTDFLKSFAWASLAIEGTQRATMVVNDNTLKLTYEGSEVISMPASVVGSDGMSADFPVGMLSTMAGYVESDNVLLGFHHEKVPTILRVTGDTQKANCAHFIQSMKSR